MNPMGLVWGWKRVLPICLVNRGVCKPPSFQNSPNAKLQIMLADILLKIFGLQAQLASHWSSFVGLIWYLKRATSPASRHTANLPWEAEQTPFISGVSETCSLRPTTDPDHASQLRPHPTQQPFVKELRRERWTEGGHLCGQNKSAVGLCLGQPCSSFGCYGPHRAGLVHSWNF